VHEHWSARPGAERRQTVAHGASRGSNVNDISSSGRRRAAAALWRAAKAEGATQRIYKTATFLPKLFPLRFVGEDPAVIVPLDEIDGLNGSAIRCNIKRQPPTVGGPKFVLTI